MKHLLLCLAFLGLTAVTWAAKPEDRFLDAYFLIQDADAAVQKSDWANAHAKFTGAQAVLQEIKTATPEWNPHIIDFRLNYCRDQLRKLQDKVPASPPAPAPPPPSATVAEAAAATSAEATKRIETLTAELSTAHAQIEALQKGRDDLQSRLQAALQKVTPAETNVRIEELLEQNKTLSAQLAATQQRLEDLSGQAEELQAAQKRIQTLETTRNELTAKLQAAEAKTTKVQAESDERINQLIKRNEELTAELKNTQGQLAEMAKGAPASAAQTAEIAKLREQLAVAVAEMERSQQDLTLTMQTLGGVRQELASVREENTKLRQSYSDLTGKLKEAESKVAALELGARKDDQIILYLRKENALLKEIADKRVAAAPAKRKSGFLWWSTPEPTQPRPAAPAEPTPPHVTESASEKLVAEITAAPSPKAATAPPRADVPAAFPAASPEVQVLLEKGKAAVGAKDYPTAIATYRAVLDVDPNNLLALSNLGVVHYQQGNLEEAETALRRAVAIAPNDSESRALLGIVYFRKGKLEEAFAELTRAIAINPRHAQAHNYLGITLSEKGWGAAAEQEMRKAVELDPKYADAHFNLAVYYAGLRTPRYELSKYHYQKAIDLGAQPDEALAAQLKKGEPAIAK